MPNAYRIAHSHPLFSLENNVIGCFLKLIQFGDRMTIKGVFVDEAKIWTAIDLCRAVCGFADETFFPTLIEMRMIGWCTGVYYLENTEQYYGSQTYTVNDVIPVMGTLKKALDPSRLEEAMMRMQAIAQIRKNVLPKQLKDEVIDMYKAFGPHRGLAVMYIGSFRSKKAIDVGGKMSLTKHHRLVRELLEMYLSCQFDLDGVRQAVSKDAFVRALMQTGQRAMHDLKSHNYLKKVAISESERTTSGVQRNEPKRVQEGY